MASSFKEFEVLWRKEPRLDGFIYYPPSIAGITDIFKIWNHSYLLEIKADGYDKWRKHLAVNSEDATISIELTESEDAEKTEDTETESIEETEDSETESIEETTETAHQMNVNKSSEDA